MTLDKAKAIVTRLSNGREPWDLNEKVEALLLAGEAIEALLRSRLGDPPLDGERLPGETEE